MGPTGAAAGFLEAVAVEGAFLGASFFASGFGASGFFASAFAGGGGAAGFLPSAFGAAGLAAAGGCGFAAGFAGAWAIARLKKTSAIMSISSHSANRTIRIHRRVLKSQEPTENPKKT
jgi:hypothetical protein